MERGRTLLHRVKIAGLLKAAIPRLTARLGVVSHHSDISILEGALASAALDGRLEVTAADLLAVAPLALGHRLPRHPQSPTADLEDRDLRRILEDVLEQEERGGAEKKAACG